MIDGAGKFVVACLAIVLLGTDLVSWNFIVNLWMLATSNLWWSGINLYILVGAVQKQSKQINLSAGKYWGSSLLMMLGLKRM